MEGIFLYEKRRPFFFAANKKSWNSKSEKNWYALPFNRHKFIFMDLQSSLRKNLLSTKQNFKLESKSRNAKFSPTHEISTICIGVLFKAQTLRNHTNLLIKTENYTNPDRTIQPSNLYSTTKSFNTDPRTDVSQI